jgi:hypothetical protein
LTACVRLRRAERRPQRRVNHGFSGDRRLTWLVALLLGSVLELGLRLVLFVAATVVVRVMVVALAALLPLVPSLDPQRRAACSSRRWLITTTACVSSAE